MKTQIKKLKNGTTVIAIQRKTTKIVSVLVGVSVGCEHETNSENGIAHFLEHMCFKGTKKFKTPKELRIYLDSLGVYANAYTSNFNTGYYISGLKNKYIKILDLVSDMFLNSTFPPKEIEKEKGVILEEIKMKNIDPNRFIYDILDDILHQGTVAGRRVLGSPKNIKKFKQKDFIDFYKKHYTPKNTIVVVVGDIKTKKIFSDVNKIFGVTKNIKKTENPIIKDINKYKSVIKKTKIENTTLGFGFRIPKKLTKNKAELRVLNAVLGLGTSSRLFAKIREEMGGCYSIQALLYNHPTYGDFYITTGIDSKRTKEIYKAILKELKKMKDTLVEKDELEKAKTKLLSSESFALESNGSILQRCFREYVVSGKVLSFKESTDAIKKVTAKQVQNCAKNIFKKKNFAIAVLGSSTITKKTLEKEVNDIL